MTTFDNYDGMTKTDIKERYCLDFDKSYTLAKKDDINLVSEEDSEMIMSSSKQSAVGVLNQSVISSQNDDKQNDDGKS